MRSWIASLLLAAAAAATGLAAAAPPAAPLAWHDLGTTVDDNYQSRWPSVAIAARQQPVVAYARTTTTVDGRQVNNVFVERWNGAAWVPLAGTLNVRPRFAAELPRVAVAAGDRPVVAWYEAQNEESSRFAVYAKRWNGSAWEPLGGALNGDPRRSALSPSLAIGPDGQPVVAFAEAAVGGLAVQVRRWDGASWQPVGAAGDIGLGAETQVAVDAAGRITVAYTTEVSFGLRQVFAKRWDGTQWSALGGTPNRDPSRPSAAPSLVAAADGRLTLAWQEQVESANKVYAAQWAEDDGAWQPLGGALDGGVAERSTVLPKVALLKSGLPVIAWTEAATMQTSVQRWTGSAWRLLGDNPVSTAEQRGYDLKVDGKGRPVLAHGEAHAIFVGDIRVQRFGPIDVIAANAGIHEQAKR